MDSTSERLSRTLWVGVGLVIVLVAIAYVLSGVKPRHPKTAPMPVLGQVADFSLTNEQGRAVSMADLRGHVWVADIIFTRCPGPCAAMSRRMSELQTSLPTNSSVRLVSLTTDPDFDTPEVLKTYGSRFDADPKRWSFLTGSKKAIAGLAIDSLKLTAIEKKPEERENPEDLFIHSTIFVAVDKQGRLRGIFETVGEGVEWTNVQPAIVSVVQRLEKE